jgi:sec-independent protein translocase protein TatC
MVLQYLKEIQYRLFFSFIAWCFMLVICYYFKETLLYLFIRPSSSFNKNLFYFVTTNITEIFTTYIQISYFISNQIIILFIFYQSFIFVSEGLYEFEYVYMKTILLTITFCWVFSLIILNYIIFPTSWEFFLGFQEQSFIKNSTFHFETKLSEYVTFYESIYYLSNFICQTLVLIFLIFYFIKTNIKSIKRIRKFFYFLCFLFATILTPPEIVFQLITGISIIIIYELIVILLVLKTKLI